jgi:hypothetical protein
MFARVMTRSAVGDGALSAQERAELAGATTGEL